MALNETYSYKSFKRQQFVERDLSEFDGDIIGACFHQTTPYSDVFPNGITARFVRCNLDNCVIPPTATVIGGTNKHFAIQNDKEYWLVDISGTPTAPRDPAKFDACGLSKLPKDIPANPINQPITFINNPEKIERDKIEALKNNYNELKAYLIAKGDLPPESSSSEVN